MSQDNSNESPAEASSTMDLGDQTTDVFVSEDESSTSSNNANVDESNGDMLSAIRGIAARNRPLRPRPVHTGFIPPSRRSSTGTSAFTMSDDDETDEDESLSVSASDMIRLAQRREKENPLMPLPESSLEESERSVSASNELMPPPPAPSDATMADNEEEEAGEISVASSALSHRDTAGSKRATVIGSQESIFSAVGHTTTQSQRSARLKTSTPGMTLGRESQLSISSQLDVSAIPQAGFSTSIPSSNEGLVNQSSREMSSSSSNSRSQRPGSSRDVQRRLTFDGMSKSAQGVLLEHPVDVLESSSTGILSYVEETIDEPMALDATTPGEAAVSSAGRSSQDESATVGDEQNPSEMVESGQGDNNDEEEEDVAQSGSQCSMTGFSSDARKETASTASSAGLEQIFFKRLALAQECSMRQNLQVLDDLPVDSLASLAIRPSKAHTMTRPNFQPKVVFSGNDRKVAETHKKKEEEERAASSSSKRPGAAAASAAEDSPASESRFEVEKRFVRSRKKTSESSSQNRHPSEIYGTVISVIQRTNSLQSSQGSRVGSSSSQQQQSREPDSWQQSQPLPSIEEPPFEDKEDEDVPVSPLPVTNGQSQPETRPDLIAGAPQGGDITPASNSARKSSQRKSNAEEQQQQTPIRSTASTSRRSLVEERSSYAGSTESLFPQNIRDPTPKRQSGSAAAASKGNGTGEDPAGRAGGRGGEKEEKRKDRSKSSSSNNSSPKEDSYRSLNVEESRRSGFGADRSASSGAGSSTASRASAREQSLRRERASEAGGRVDIQSPVNVVNLRKSHMESKSPRLSRRILIQPRDSSSSDNESSSRSRPRKSHSKVTRDDDKTKDKDTSREAQQSGRDRPSDPGVATLRNSRLESKSPRLSRRSLYQYEDSDEQQELPLPRKSPASLGNGADSATAKASKKLSAAGKEVPIAAQRSSGEVLNRSRVSERTPKKQSVGKEVPIIAAPKSSTEISRDPTGGRRSTAGSQPGYRASQSLIPLEKSSSSDNDDGLFSPRKSQFFPLPTKVAASRIDEISSSELEVTTRSRPPRRRKHSKSRVEDKTAGEQISKEASNLTLGGATAEGERRKSSKSVVSTPGKSAAELPATLESQSHDRSKPGHENDADEGSQRRSSTFVVPNQVQRRPTTSSSSSRASAKASAPLTLALPGEESARRSRSRSRSSAWSDTTQPIIRKSFSGQRLPEDDGVLEEPDRNSDVEMNAASGAEDSDDKQEVRAPSVLESSGEESEALEEDEEAVGSENLESVVAKSGRSSKQSSFEEQRSARTDSMASRNASRAEVPSPKDSSQRHGSGRVTKGSSEPLAEDSHREKTASRAASNLSISSTSTTKLRASTTNSIALSTKSISSAATETLETSAPKKDAVKASRPSLNVARKSVVLPAKSSLQSTSIRSNVTVDKSRRLSKESTSSKGSVPSPSRQQAVGRLPSPQQINLVAYSDNDDNEDEDEVAAVATSGMLDEQMDSPVGVADDHFSEPSSSSCSSSEDQEPVSKASKGKRSARVSEGRQTSGTGDRRRQKDARQASSSSSSEDQEPVSKAIEGKRSARVSEGKQTSGTGDRRREKDTRQASSSSSSEDQETVSKAIEGKLSARVSEGKQTGKAKRPSLVVAKKSVVVSPMKSTVLGPRRSKRDQSDYENTRRETRESTRRDNVEELRTKDRGGRKMSRNVENLTRASNDSTRPAHGESSSSGSENHDDLDKAGEAEAREVSWKRSDSKSRKRKTHDDDSESEGSFVPPVEVQPSRVSLRDEPRRLTQSPRRAADLSQRFDSVIKKNQERQGSGASRPSVPEEPVASTSKGPRRSIPEKPVAGTSEGRTGARSNTATAAASTAGTGRKRGPKPKPPMSKTLAKLVSPKDCITEHIVRCRMEALDMEMSNAEVRKLTAHLNKEFEEMLTELQSKTLRDEGMFGYRELEQALWNRGLLYKQPTGRGWELLCYFAHVLNPDDYAACQKAGIIPKGTNIDTGF